MAKIVLVGAGSGFGAHLILPQIHSMFDELWEAEGDLLAYFSKGKVAERCYTD